MNLTKIIHDTIIEYLNEDIFRTDNSIKKYEKLLIDAVVNFMKEKFNFDANIIVKKKQNNSLIGDISLNDNSINYNKFTLHFNPNQSYLSVIKSLIHELTHIKQVSKGELTAANDYKSIIWNNDYVLPVKDYNIIMKNFNDYSKLPWEAEAYQNMNDMSLRDEFFRSKYWINLKGLDVTLDYIMDNIL